MGPQVQWWLWMKTKTHIEHLCKWKCWEVVENTINQSLNCLLFLPIVLIQILHISKKQSALNWLVHKLTTEYISYTGKYPDYFHVFVSWKELTIFKAWYKSNKTIILMKSNKVLHLQVQWTGPNGKHSFLQVFTFKSGQQFILNNKEWSYLSIQSTPMTILCSSSSGPKADTMVK